MQTIDYKKYMNLVSDETKKYINEVIRIIVYKSRTVDYGDRNRAVDYLFPFVNAYRNLYPNNTEALNDVIKSNKFNLCNIGSSSYSYEYYKEQYNKLLCEETAFFPDYIEELCLLTPEDILLKAINNATERFSRDTCSKAFNDEKTDGLDNINSVRHMLLQDKVDKENFAGLTADEIEYLKTTGKIFAYLRDRKKYVTFIDPTTPNIALLATLGGILKSPYLDIKELYFYMNNNGLTFESYSKLFGALFKDELLNEYDPTAIINYYFTKDDLKKIVDGDNCYGNSAEQLKAMLTIVLGKFRISYDSIANHYLRKEEEEKERSLIKEYRKNAIPFFKTFFNIYENIKESSVNVKDKEKAAILLGLFYYKDNFYLKFLNHNGVQLSDVIKDLGLEKVDLTVERPISDDTLRRFFPYIPELKNLNISEFLNGNTFLVNFCKEHNINYEYLKYELSYRTYKTLTKEEQLQKFESLTIPALVVDSVPALTSYGDQLSEYNEVITTEMGRLPQSVSFEELTNALKKLKPIQRPGLIARIFNKKEELTVDNINSVRVLIDGYIDTLRDEIEAYDYLKRYITVYLSKLFFVRDNYKNSADYHEALIKAMDQDDPRKYALLVDYKTKLDIARASENSSTTSIELNHQELLKICNIIKSHNNTINALTMAKNDILPLIASEATINRGIHSERESMMLSQNLVGLFQSLVDNNIESTKKNLDLLQTSPLSQDVLDKVNVDITSYIESVEETDSNKGIGLGLKKEEN